MDIIQSLVNENWTGILVAVFCGGFIGLERQLRGKAAGIRTSILICLGTLTFIEVSRSIETAQTDPTRVLGQIITGIGFLGAGVILTRGGTLAGVTSASVIWVLSAIGVAIGYQHYAQAIVLTFMTIIVLSGVSLFEGYFSQLRKESHADAGHNEKKGE